MLGVIIICGSNLQTLHTCLSSLQDQCASLHLVLINNQALSASDLVEVQPLLLRLDPQVVLIDNQVSRSFAHNNNVALAQLPDSCEFVLLLNDDVILLPHTLRRLLEAIQADPLLGAVGPVLMNPDGSLQSARWHYPWSTYGVLHALLGQWAARAGAHEDQFWISCACMLARAAVLRQVGGMDERFEPGYGEDIDLCARLQQVGYRLQVCDDLSVIHLGGQSFGAQSLQRHRLSLRGVLRAVDKWSPRWWAFAFRLAWCLGLLMRWCVARLAVLLRRSPVQRAEHRRYAEMLREVCQTA